MSPMVWASRERFADLRPEPTDLRRLPRRPVCAGKRIEMNRVGAAAIGEMWLGVRSPRWPLSPPFRRCGPRVRRAWSIDSTLPDRRGHAVAATHHNTEHPHIHVALRGVDRDGHALRLHRDFIKQGMREIAEDLCLRGNLDTARRWTLPTPNAAR